MWLVVGSIMNEDMNLKGLSNAKDPFYRNLQSIHTVNASVVLSSALHVHVLLGYAITMVYTIKLASWL